jgi:hypothetical protein
MIDHLERIENQTGRRIKRIRMDNGTEFSTLVSYYKSKGITLMLTTAHNSKQNGRAEVSNYLVERMARTMMIAGKVQRFLWPWAVRTAVQLLNTTPSSTIGMAPIQMLAELGDNWKTTVNLGHFKAYGCRAYVYNESVPRGDKYSSRVLIGKLVGYERGATNIFYVYIPEKGKVLRTTDVEFDESRFDTSTDVVIVDPDEDNGYIDPTDDLYSTPVSTSSGGEKMSIEELPTVDESEHSSEELKEHIEDFINTGMPEPGVQAPHKPPERSETQVQLESDPEDSITVATRPPCLPETSSRRSQRERIRTDKALANAAQGLTPYGTKQAVVARRIHKVYFTSVAFKGDSQLKVQDIVIPQSYDEAIASPQAEHWRAAMQSETGSLDSNDTWDLVDPLDYPDVTIIAGRWVFTIKATSEGLVDRFKARWVARGFT